MCNKPGHYANACPLRIPRVKQLEFELTALRADEATDLADSGEEDLLLPSEEGPIVDMIRVLNGLTAFHIAPHLFNEEEPFKTEDASISMQYLMIEPAA